MILSDFHSVMVADIVPDMEVDMVADMEVDKVADNKKMTLTLTWKSNLVKELVTGSGQLCPNVFDPKQYPACSSSRLCEFILKYSWVRNQYYEKFCGAFCKYFCVCNTSPINKI